MRARLDGGARARRPLARGRDRARPASGRTALRLRGAASRARGARARRGRERAAELRPRRPAASSSRSRTAARRSARRTCSGGSTRGCSSRTRRFRASPNSSSPSLPPGAASSGASSASSFFPMLRSSASARPERHARLGRALQSFADLRTGDYVVHEDHGVGKLLGFETRTVAGVTRDYLFARVQGRRPPLRPARADRQGVSLHRRRRTAPALSKLGGKRLAADQVACARKRARAGRRAARALRAPPDRARASRTTSRTTGSSASRPSSPTARPRTSSARSRRSRRTSRRRTRWTGSSAATSASARRRSRSAPPSPSAVNGKQTLMLVPTTILAQQHWNTFRERYREFPIRVEMISRLRPPARAEAGARRLRRGEGGRPHRHAPAPLARRHPEEPRPRHPRRGAALRRCPEGAAPLAAAGGRRARALGDADPAHAAYVAVGTARHLRDRNPARGAARRSGRAWGSTTRS